MTYRDEFAAAFDSSRHFRAEVMADMFDEAADRIADRERERRVTVELAELRKERKAADVADALTPLLDQLTTHDTENPFDTKEN